MSTAVETAKTAFHAAHVRNEDDHIIEGLETAVAHAERLARAGCPRTTSCLKCNAPMVSTGPGHRLHAGCRRSTDLEPWQVPS